MNFFLMASTKRLRLRWAVGIGLAGIALAVCADTGVIIKHQGSLRAVHNGDSRATQQLSPLLAQPGLVAMGPAAGLNGEITAFDGKLWVTRVTADKKAVTFPEAHAQAAFLVWAHVAQWGSPVLLGKSAIGHAQLETLIEVAAVKNGIDTSKPFAFQLVGLSDKLQYQVLTPLDKAGAPSGDVQTHSASQAAAPDHKSQALNLSQQGQPAQIVGFYSRSHEGVFTHRGSRAHLHVIDAQGHTGHIDEIATPANMQIVFAMK